MSKKKIGLLSVYNHNYGSILQAYALQNVLQSLGHSTEIIRYKKTNYIKQAQRLFYVPLLKATVKMKCKDLYCKVFQNETYKNVLLTRETAFTEFISENLHFSDTYRGREKLTEACNKYDCFILGSDQVWNPMNLGGDFYTMTFVPDEIKKITYAPSFGVAKIPNNQKKKTADYLKRIDYISVREDAGCRIIKQLTGRDVPMVVDPTILMAKNNWDEMRGDRIVSDDYIFCYFISAIGGYREFAKTLAKKTGLKIVTIPHVDEFVKADVGFGDLSLNGIGPKEFVNLISNATYVCTDSFHGTVFSTLYQKTFFTFSRYAGDSADSTNSLLYSFLKLIGLGNRLFQDKSELSESDLKNIDFEHANVALTDLREKSMGYLINALNAGGE